MSGEATPRPWRVTSDDVEAIFIVGGDDEAILAMTDSDAFEDAEDLANADLIVQAVNTFSEREALLREFLDVCDHATESEARHGNDDEAACWQDRADRIRATLRETEEKEKP